MSFMTRAPGPPTSGGGPAGKGEPAHEDPSSAARDDPADIADSCPTTQGSTPDQKAEDTTGETAVETVRTEAVCAQRPRRRSH